MVEAILSQVHERLPAGAKGIRTAGPPVKRDGVFRDHPDRPPAPSPPGESSERDRGFESTSLHQGVMNKSSQAANLPQAANRPTLTGEGLMVRIPFPPPARPTHAR